MKKHSILWAGFLIACLLLPVGLLANARVETSPENTGYRALAPNSNPITSFDITAYTSSSISLAWSSSVPNLYFKLEGVNNSSTTPLPPVYTQGYSHTYNNLPSGNNFTFRLYYRVSPSDPWEYAARVNGNTIIIVVEEIVEFGDGEPQYPYNPGVNDSFSIPLLPSQAEFPEINNHFLAQFEFQNEVFRFAIGLNQDTIYAGELYDKEGVFYLNDASPLELYCVHATHGNIFKLKSPSFNTGGTSVKATFLQQVYNYQFTPAGEVPLQMLPKDRKPIDAFDRSVAAQLNLLPRPNPFNTGTSVAYFLENDGPVYISLNDALGRLVKVVENNTQQKAGLHQALINGAGIPDGIYYLHMQTGSECRVHTLVKRE